MTAQLTRGAHHVGLTVPDLDAAVRFFCEVLGFTVTGGNADYPATFVSDGHVLLTLWRAADPTRATALIDAPTSGSITSHSQFPTTKRWMKPMRECAAMPT